MMSKTTIDAWLERIDYELSEHENTLAENPAAPSIADMIAAGKLPEEARDYYKKKE